MIEEIEGLLVHWGEQVNTAGTAGGLSSTLGTIMEYGGCAPRGGVCGARILLGGAGLDYVAGEVEAGLAVVERAAGGALLSALAQRRYVERPALSVAEQVHDLGIGLGEAGRRAYSRQVHQLHELLAAALASRLGLHVAQQQAAKRGGDRVRRKGRRQAMKAHQARGVELYKTTGA